MAIVVWKIGYSDKGMRSPEEQEHFLAHGRFNLPLANDQRLSVRALAIVACGYWALAAAAFFINFFVCFFLTIPWSYLVISLRMRLPESNMFVEFVDSGSGRFLVFPLLCGGLNILTALLIVKFLTRYKEDPD
jgi:hypothetical protein